MPLTKDLRNPGENFLFIQGRVTRQPEKREVISNALRVNVTRFGLAWNDWKKNAHFFDVECWRELADRAAKLEKGQPVQVRGRVEIQTYEKEGNTIKRTVIIADRVESLVWPVREGEQATQPETENDNIGPDDIPF